MKHREESPFSGPCATRMSLVKLWQNHITRLSLSRVSFGYDIRISLCIRVYHLDTSKKHGMRDDKDLQTHLPIDMLFCKRAQVTARPLLTVKSEM